MVRTAHGSLRDVQNAPSLLPIFRSPGQARLLTRLLLDPGHHWRSLSELARAVGLAPSSVQREVERLARAGIVETERVGNVRRVRADAGSRFYPELRALVAKAFGPPAVLGAALAALPGVQGGYLFGSWARAALDPEALAEPPRDIDLLVVGEPDPDALYRACAQAEAQLGLEVAPVIVSPADWEAAGEPGAPPFLTALRAGPLVALEPG
jgi:DNA-binding transcriptional ArsR family regulator